jgi:hypothetical protein
LAWHFANNSFSPFYTSALQFAILNFQQLKLTGQEKFKLQWFKKTNIVFLMKSNIAEFFPYVYSHSILFMHPMKGV